MQSPTTVAPPTINEFNYLIGVYIEPASMLLSLLWSFLLLCLYFNVWLLTARQYHASSIKLDRDKGR